MKNAIKLSLTLLATLMLFIACDQNDPLSAPNTEQKITILKKSQMSLSKLFTKTQRIDITGGKIKVGDRDTGFSGLDFPYGAINPSDYQATFAYDAQPGVDIGITWQSEGFLEAEFTPHGIQFDEPVYVRLSYKDADLDDVDEDNLRIYYYNEITQEYELVSSNVNTEGEYVYGYINHFSRYSIGYGE